jgi:SAM-dependent methyltransferase
MYTFGSIRIMDLSAVASRIRMGPEGVWISPTVSTVSYPEEDNNICFAVEEDSFWFAHRNQAIVETVRRFPPPGTFFDVGGGNGYVAKALQDSGIEVVLVEPGKDGARNARERGVAHIMRCTLQDACFRPGVIPALGLFDVIEHVEDDRRYFSDVRSHLVPGGRVYLTVPAFQMLWSQEDVDAGHWRRYTLSRICALLKASGFEIDYATYFFSYLLLPIYFLRALPFSLGISPKKDVKERTQKDHRITNPLVHQLIDWLNRCELACLDSGRRINIGASCLVVARKPAS